MADDTKAKTSSMDSTFPVLLPEDLALTIPSNEFDKHVHKLLSGQGKNQTGIERAMAHVGFTCSCLEDDSDDESDAFVDASTSLDQDIGSSNQAEAGAPKGVPGHPFMNALVSARDSPDDSMPKYSSENKTFTEKGGVAHRSTNSSLVDLFSELEKSITGPRLDELLEKSWREDPEASLKIIWNARSIHLGKGEKESFYRCMGWLKQSHPETVVLNLKWMFRAVIEKKVRKDVEDDAVMVRMDEGESTVLSAESEHDVLHGVSHGYWKDLLNLLVLEVNSGLEVLKDPRLILHVKNEQIKASKTAAHGNKRRKITSKQDDKNQNSKAGNPSHADPNVELRRITKDKKHKEEADRHASCLKKFESNVFYRALHLTVARLFAEQLRKDMSLLKSGQKKDIKHISLAAKWAPSLEGFHDKHTFIASSIAEILYPQSAIGNDGDTRDRYLRRAREWYRRFTISPLRKALEVVERDISANTFGFIKYQKVPSIAMDKNKDLFARKDLERFETYLDRVAHGKSRISGAVLMPGLLVKQARETGDPNRQLALRLQAEESDSGGKPAKADAKKLMKAKVAAIQSKALDGQWNTLVQRIRDSGMLQSSIAVCDVSGSMEYPNFDDGTVPMDTSVGLSLLLAEVTQPPFGGAFITFSETPSVHRIGGPGDSRDFATKVQSILKSDWGYNTNFLSVFENLVLPMAVDNKLKKEDMVKQIFVFSDMQFDAAENSSSEPLRWETAYERIKRKFSAAGYDMPKLIFWNLAGGRPSVFKPGDSGLPKPVTKEMEGTALVSGYSQAQMKMFLEEGQFGDEEEEEEEEEEEIVDVDMVDGDGVEVSKKKNKEKDPLNVVMQAVGHPAYRMLKVYD
ncbi:MAG: hypothetical protein M1827_006169 [Pycnora praestabilis]|nr:MAG: hypothetical protein M1827_006169 [Pycnora praestabilis]